MNRLIRKKSSFLVFVFLAGVVFVSHAEKEVKGEEPAVTGVVKAAIIPVRAIEAYSMGRKPTRWYSGVSEGDPTIEYSFKVGGTVSAIKVRAGVRLRHDRLIARLDPTEYEITMEKLEATLAKATIKLLKAKAKLDRARKSFEKGEISADEIKTAYAAVRTADRTIRTNRKRLQGVQRMREYHDLVFTHRGTVKSVNVKVGDKVKAGQTIAVFKLTMPVEVTVNLPAILISKIGVAGKGKVKFNGLKGIYPAIVTHVGDQTSGPGATFPVTVRLRHPRPNIHGGMKADVAFRFDYRARKKRFILPPDAVGEDGQGSYVYVVNPTGGDYGTIERRPVTVGGLTAQGQGVIDGIQNGEVVVTHGIRRLQVGMKVKYK